MAKTNLDKLTIKCECGGKMQNTLTTWKGIKIRAWKCKRCGEEVLNPVDAQRALEIARARKKNEFKVKFRKCGKSTIITVPQIITERFNIREGAKAEWSVKAKNRFEVNVLCSYLFDRIFSALLIISFFKPM